MTNLFAPKIISKNPYDMFWPALLYAVGKFGRKLGNQLKSGNSLIEIMSTVLIQDIYRDYGSARKKKLATLNAR